MTHFLTNPVSGLGGCSTTSQRSQEMLTIIVVRNTYCSLLFIHVTTVFDAVPLQPSRPVVHVLLFPEYSRNIVLAVIIVVLSYSCSSPQVGGLWRIQYRVEY
eukprot:1194208-Prorocentrum_minimum.AAC.1